MSDEPTPDESIWKPLDGSAPPTPGASTQPLSFTKPEPRPLTLPGGSAVPTEAAAGTPSEQAVFVLAGWWRRLGAYLFDGLVFGLAVLAVTVPLAMVLGMTFEESSLFLTAQSVEVPDAVATPALAWALLALQIVGQASLSAIFLARWQGQTPGKRILGIRVVMADGTPLALGSAMNREVIGKGLIVGVLTVITFGIAFLANYLWPLFDGQNRAGHDQYAKTRVVMAPRG